MNDKIYSITLADGTVLDNLRLNGNNYISDTPVEKEIFDNNCSVVVISDGESHVTYENMECVQVTKMGEEYWFILRELSADELAAIKNRADLEYIAMMCDIDL